MGFCTHNLYVKHTKIGLTDNLFFYVLNIDLLKNGTSQNIDEKGPVCENFRRERPGPAQSTKFFGP